jgi:transcriptional regulator with XRE-family HTH domain
LNSHSFIHRITIVTAAKKYFEVRKVEKKTMGSFLAVLRKSKGMTQQDVAKSLNVSNKTISKWERGEGYPEITIIPAIAELFGVTADEILRGEKIASGEEKTKGSDKQLRSLLKRMNVKFGNLSYLAAALIGVGVISLFTISYGFYKPVLGFGVMVLFVISGMILELVAINNINSSYEQSGLLEEKTAESFSYLKLLFNKASTVFSAAVFAVIPGLPFILVQSSFGNSVINFSSYLRFLPLLLLLSLLVISVGRYIGRKNIERKYFPLLEEEEIKKRISLNIKFIITAFVVFSLTLAGHIYTINKIDKTLVAEKFETRELFEAYISDVEQYKKELEAAREDDSIIVTPPDRNGKNIANVEIIVKDGEYFYLVPEYDNIKKIDNEEMTVFHELDPILRSARTSTANSIFVTLYVIEAVALLSAYVVLKKRIGSIV